jgi:hypothetical protein
MLLGWKHRTEPSVSSIMRLMAAGGLATADQVPAAEAERALAAKPAARTKDLIKDGTAGRGVVRDMIDS